MRAGPSGTRRSMRSDWPGFAYSRPSYVVNVPANAAVERNSAATRSRDRGMAV
jgi:hypothetical protein